MGLYESGLQLSHSPKRHSGIAHGLDNLEAHPRGKHKAAPF